jgi:hypothetical protein
MTFVVFPHSAIVPAADKAGSPYCGQTNDAGIENCQQLIAVDEPTCKKCCSIVKLLREGAEPEPAVEFAPEVKFTPAVRFDFRRQLRHHVTTTP